MGIIAQEKKIYITFPKIRNHWRISLLHWIIYLIHYESFLYKFSNNTWILFYCSLNSYCFAFFILVWNAVWKTDKHLYFTLFREIVSLSISNSVSNVTKYFRHLGSLNLHESLAYILGKSYNSATHCILYMDIDGVLIKV